MAVLGALALSGVTQASMLALATAAALIVVLIVHLTRTMAQFMCLVIAFRPLIDVGSGSRQTAVSPTEIVGVTLLGVFGFWLLRNRQAVWERIRRDRMSWALAALLAVLVLSTVGSVGPVGSLPFVLRMATGCAVYLVVDLLLSRREVTVTQLLTAAFVAASVALVFPTLGVLGVPVIHSKDGLPALKSVFHLSNNFAYFLLPFILVAAALTLRARGRRQFFAGAFLVVALFELGLTQTRGAWMSAFVGLLVVGWLLERRLLWVPVVLTALIILFVPPVHDRVESVVPSSDQVRTESSGTWRLQHWDELLPMASASPVLGLGPDQSVKLTGKEPHNDMLRSYVELGLAGSLVFLWWLTEMVILAARAWSRVRDLPRAGPADVYSSAGGLADVAPAVVAGLAGFIGALLVAFTGENLMDNITMLLLLMPTLAILRSVASEPSPGGAAESHQLAQGPSGQV